MVYLSNIIYEIGELSQFQNFHQSKGTLIQKKLTKVICQSFQNVPASHAKHHNQQGAHRCLSNLQNSVHPINTLFIQKFIKDEYFRQSKYMTSTLTPLDSLGRSLDCKMLTNGSGSFTRMSFEALSLEWAVSIGTLLQVEAQIL